MTIIQQEGNRVYLSAPRLTGRVSVTAGLSSISVCAGDVYGLKGEGTFLTINGISYNVTATFRLNETDEWVLSFDAMHLRRVEPKVGTFDRDPTSQAYRTTREILTETVRKWASENPALLAGGVEEARADFRATCNKTIQELQNEFVRLNQARGDALSWDQSQLMEAVEKREAYAHNYSVR